MNASGQPITHSPSMRDCVERVPSLSKSSSETSVADAAGPSAIERDWTASAGALREIVRAARADGRAKRASMDMDGLRRREV